MAKQDNTNVEEEATVMDTMPGADPKSPEDLEGYKVDLNFEDTQEEEDVEDESETEEEPQEGTEEVEEEEEAEAVAEEAESGGEETVLEDDAGDTQQPEGTDEAEPVEEAPETVEEKEPMIPKSRFDEVLQKQKALQKKLDEALAPQIEDVKEAPEYDFDAKEAEYASLLMEGENEKAIQLRNEIRSAEKQQMMYEMQAKMGQTVTQNQELVDLQTKAQQLESIFPELNQADPNFNQDKTNEVLELRDAYMSQGYTGADALQKAVDLIMPTPNTEPAPDPTVKKVAEKKQIANTKKKIEAAEKQPPTMKGKNKVDKKVDINTMSVDEFDALPAETLKRMRGDFG